jgi:hypothetical protein
MHGKKNLKNTDMHNRMKTSTNCHVFLQLGIALKKKKKKKTINIGFTLIKNIITVPQACQENNQTHNVLTIRSAHL